MPISNLSSGSRPGVCTSTTRPTAPFEGQMIFETDTNRVLVWDNAAWVMIADTDQPPGIQLVGSGTFTNVTTVDVIGFSTDFEAYRLVYNHRRTDTSGNTSASFQFRSSTTPQGSGYYYGGTYGKFDGASGSLVNGNNVSEAWFSGPDSFAGPSSQSYDITVRQGFGVTWHGTGFYTGASYTFQYGGAVGTSLTIDRMRITYGVANSASGTWRLYGYRI